MSRAWPFTLICPKGHRVAEEGYDRRTIRSLLNEGRPIAFYCPSCDARWDASVDELAYLRWALDQSP